MFALRPLASLLTISRTSWTNFNIDLDIASTCDKVALVGEIAVPCNLQSATAGMNSHMRGFAVSSVPVSGVEESVLRNGLP